ncbi:dephospho-CoA kinase [Caldalkalibacillus uzonensis]|uniref:Dephospho-CoA kinase n=1 Tax=Caldalkalibacillus uzonensis TaxID=353224 RepID=A0ABU0CN40_9BACI|nr:dephospho-CoA kinase [Caldalkalibacillus uzonensis]MDQ0337840.1 dephospho-CoA kinase [Caldalkalibacillus uzonensis]
MVIGLTGGIASGKSTVSRMLADLGAVLIDADKIARKVVEPGQPAWQQIKEVFGEEVLKADGRLDRAKLAKIIFHDPEQRRRLNGIVHPAIRKKMLEEKEAALNRGQDLIVMDIPLLFESELEHMVDKILVVYVPQEVQIQRLMERDQIDRDYALQKIGSQMPLETKKEKGHAYIDNSGSRDETRAQLVRILQEWGINSKR